MGNVWGSNKFGLLIDCNFCQSYFALSFSVNSIIIHAMQRPQQQIQSQQASTLFLCSEKSISSSGFAHTCTGKHLNSTIQ